MIIENLKKNITKYISTASVICLIFTKPAMSLNYENYEKWLNQFFINNFHENYSPKFIKEIIKESKLNKVPEFPIIPEFLTLVLFGSTIIMSLDKI